MSQTHLPHEQFPLPLQIRPFDDIHVDVSVEHEQAGPSQPGSHLHSPQSHCPLPPQIRPK